MFNLILSNPFDRVSGTLIQVLIFSEWRRYRGPKSYLWKNHSKTKFCVWWVIIFLFFPLKFFSVVVTYFYFCFCFCFCFCLAWFQVSNGIGDLEVSDLVGILVVTSLWYRMSFTLFKSYLPEKFTTKIYMYWIFLMIYFYNQTKYIFCWTSITYL